MTTTRSTVTTAREALRYRPAGEQPGPERGVVDHDRRGYLPRGHARHGAEIRLHRSTADCGAAFRANTCVAAGDGHRVEPAAALFAAEGSDRVTARSRSRVVGNPRRRCLHPGHAFYRQLTAARRGHASARTAGRSFPTVEARHGRRVASRRDLDRREAFVLCERTVDTVVLCDLASTSVRAQSQQAKNDPGGYSRRGRGPRGVSRTSKS